MKKILIAVICAFVSLVATAQVHVLKNGHVIVGETREGYLSGGAIDTSRILMMDTTAVMTLDGRGYKHSGAKLSFGGVDHSSIGEGLKGYMQLESGNGLTYSCGNKGIIFNYMPTGSLSGTSETNFSFSCPVQAKQYYTNSDMRFKTDISLIEGYSEGLSNLTPVSYYLNMPLKEMADSISILSSEVTEKSTNPQIGFLAQEVRSIYPELVCEDEDGNLAVDYQGFIPLLVEAVSSLKKTVSKQEKIIEQLLGLIEGVQLFDESDSDSQDAYLGQNRPNPAKGECLIEYIIPENVTTAIIELASTDGLTQHSYNIGERGKGTLKIDASYLNPGVYVYTLIVDGMEAGSHRMIVSY